MTKHKMEVKMSRKTKVGEMEKGKKKEKSKKILK